MKTYILDSLNRYKRLSEALDVKTVLCNKSWWVFNDIGEKELYIFQDDGSLIISVSGKVTNATWQYVPANKSLIISADKQSYMLHPAFMNNVIFALQLDGTEKCAFLIDENNRESFQPKSLTALELYFERIESNIEREKQKQLEHQRTEENTRKYQQMLAEKERNAAEVRKNFYNKLEKQALATWEQNVDVKKRKKRRNRIVNWLIVTQVLVGLMLGIWWYLDEISRSDEEFSVILMCCSMLLGACFGVLSYLFTFHLFWWLPTDSREERRKDKYVSDYIKSNMP